MESEIEDRIKELRFIDPEYQPGFNSTIRRGTRPAHKFAIGDKFRMLNNGQLSDQVFVINEIRVGRMLPLIYKGSEIRGKYLKMHHTAKIRNSPESFIDYMIEMRKYYPDYTPDEPVTVIVFSVEEKLI